MYSLERSDSMLQTLVDFFKSIGNVIMSLVDFVIGIIQDLVYVVKLCNEFILKIPTLFVWLPTGVIALIVVIFGIVVIYKIMGREG